MLALIDARLAAGETDGWHYDDMPEDAQAWRRHAGWLDDDARDQFDGAASPSSTGAEQAALIQAVQDLATDGEPGTAVPAAHVWSLWTRYACTAFYSHPWAWNEIGFPGPAYPRGYLNLGVDAREQWEVADHRRRRPDAVRRPGRAGPPRATHDAVRRSVRDERLPRRSAPATSRPGCCPTTASRTNHRLRDDMRRFDRRRRGRPGRRRRRRRRQRADPAAGPGRLARGRAWTPARSGTPTPTGSATSAARTRLYWTEPRQIGGADPVPLGSNNSGRGVGGSMVHYAGYTPRFHPSDFRTHTDDGVGADWPIAYADLRPYYERDRGRAAGRRAGLALGRPALLPAPPAPGRRQRRDLPARRAGGRHRRAGRPGRDPQRPLRQPAALHLPRLLPAGLQGQRQGQPADHPHPRRAGPRRRDPARQPWSPGSLVDDRTGRVDRRRATCAGGREHRQRARAVAVAGYSIETPRLLLLSATAALPRRPRQRPRPARPLPHGAGRAADRRPVRRRDPDVQGAAAGGEQRAVLRDRPDQALQARLVHPDRQPAADHLGRTRYRARALGCGAARVHARLRALGDPRRAVRVPAAARQPGHPGRREGPARPAGRALLLQPVRQRQAADDGRARQSMEDILRAAGAERGHDHRPLRPPRRRRADGRPRRGRRRRRRPPGVRRPQPLRRRRQRAAHPGLGQPGPDDHGAGRPGRRPADRRSAPRPGRARRRRHDDDSTAPDRPRVRHGGLPLPDARAGGRRHPGLGRHHRRHRAGSTPAASPGSAGPTARPAAAASIDGELRRRRARPRRPRRRRRAGRRCTAPAATSAPAGWSCRRISAVDIALWDLKARLLDVPLADAARPAAATAVPVYGSGGFTTLDDAQLAEQVERLAGGRAAPR